AGGHLARPQPRAEGDRRGGGNRCAAALSHQAQVRRGAGLLLRRAGRARRLRETAGQDAPQTEARRNLRRFSVLSENEMDPAQREAYRGIVSGPRGGARGPFNALLRSPELAEHAQKLGAYIRFKTS